LVSESNTGQSLSSPLQQIILKLLERTHINTKLLNTFAKAFPSVGESLLVLNDPNELHKAVHDMIQFLEKGLELDHDSGIAGENLCFGPDLTPPREESAEGVSSGGDGYREVDVDGSLNGGIPGSVLGTETSSEGIDL
jgi:hypothetical protein